MSFPLSSDGKRKECIHCKKWIERSNISKHIKTMHADAIIQIQTNTNSLICLGCQKKDEEIAVLKKRINELSEEIQKRNTQMRDLHALTDCTANFDTKVNPDLNPVGNCLSLAEQTRKEYKSTFEKYKNHCEKTQISESLASSVDSYIQAVYPATSNDSKIKTFGWGTRKKIRCAIVSVLKLKYPNFKIGKIARDPDYIPKNKKAITNKDFQTLLSNTNDPQLISLFKFLERTGYRINVAARVKFSNYDWDEKCYFLKDKKNNFPFKFEIEGMPIEKNSDKYVFWDEIKTARTHQFSSIVRKYMKTYLTYNSKKESIGAHCFRYKFVRTYAQKSENMRLKQISDKIGQWNSSSISSYNRKSQDRMLIKQESLRLKRSNKKKGK